MRNGVPVKQERSPRETQNQLGVVTFLLLYSTLCSEEN